MITRFFKLILIVAVIAIGYKAFIYLSYDMENIDEAEYRARSAELTSFEYGDFRYGKTIKRARDLEEDEIVKTSKDFSDVISKISSLPQVKQYMYNQTSFETAGKKYALESVGSEIAEDNCLYDVTSGERRLVSFPGNGECEPGGIIAQGTRLDFTASNKENAFIVAANHKTFYIIQDDGKIYRWHQGYREIVYEE
ncbi:MAG: hypothetical protein V4686_01970 [Patescibacteria group bacterium]